MLLSKKCEFCKKKFFKSKTRGIPSWKKAKFCSPRCYFNSLIGKERREYNTVRYNKTCKGCEKTFRVNYCRRFQKFCSQECSQKYHRGKNSYKWKGGEIDDGHGYVRVKKRNHPYCSNHGYVHKHRLVMEERLGRYLKPEEEVHHLDGNKKNNKISNLLLCKNGEHQKIVRRIWLAAVKLGVSKKVKEILEKQHFDIYVEKKEDARLYSGTKKFKVIQ